MARAKVNRIVFSSTAAVYGEPGDAHPREFSLRARQSLRRIESHGRARLLATSTITAASAAWSFATSTPAAPSPRRILAEQHDPETHLIPLLFRAAISGEPVQLFGDDYPTPDGTCVRDYIHVGDLASAHLAALDHLMAGGASAQFNVGTGAGNTVLEVLRAVEEISGRKVPYSRPPARRRFAIVSCELAKAPANPRLGPHPQRLAPNRPRRLGLLHALAAYALVRAASPLVAPLNLAPRSCTNLPYS